MAVMKLSNLIVRKMNIYQQKEHIKTVHRNIKVEISDYCAQSGRKGRKCGLRNIE